MSSQDMTNNTQAPTRKRFIIMALLFLTVVINYVDRSNLSVAAPVLGKDLGIDPVKMGLIFSAFGWSYAFCQVPGGWLADRARPRGMYAILIALWSVATASLGFARGIVMLIAMRVLIGVLESPSFPINNRIVTTWFPERERATAIGCYTAGEFVGLAFLTPLLMYLQVQWSWRMVFISLGLLGLVWAAIWYLVYRGPAQFQGHELSGDRTDPQRWRPGGSRTDDPHQEGALPGSRSGDCSGQDQTVGTLHRPIRADLDSVVLPHLVPDLPGGVSGSQFSQGRLPCFVTVPGGVLRSALFWYVVGPAAPARRFDRCRAQGPRLSRDCCYRRPSLGRTSFRSRGGSSSSWRRHFLGTGWRRSVGRWCPPSRRSACWG